MKQRREPTIAGSLADDPATRPLDEIRDALCAFYARRMVCVKRILETDRRLAVDNAHRDRVVQVDEHARDDRVAFIVYEHIVGRLGRINHFE